MLMAERTAPKRPEVLLCRERASELTRRRRDDDDETSLLRGSLQFKPVEPRSLSPRRPRVPQWPQRPHGALQRLCNGCNGRNGRVTGSASSRAVPSTSALAVGALVERVMGC